MNFFNINQLVNKIRHFPEFHLMIEAYDRIHSNEEAMIDHLSKGIPIELKVFASKQPKNISEGLNDIATAGEEQIQNMRDIVSALAMFTTDLQPLLRQETEIDSWKKVLNELSDKAQKSEEAETKASINLSNSKILGNQIEVYKAETALVAAQKRAEDDRYQAESHRAMVEYKEKLFKEDFLQDYVNPVSVMIDKRIQSAKVNIEIAEQFKSATEKFEYPTHVAQILKHYYVTRADLEKITID